MEQFENVRHAHTNNRTRQTKDTTLRVRWFVVMLDSVLTLVDTCDDDDGGDCGAPPPSFYPGLTL